MKKVRMLRVVTSTGYHHSKIVEEVVKELQNDYHDVYKVERVSRMFWLFGTDTTYIYYNDKKGKHTT